MGRKIDDYTTPHIIGDKRAGRNSRGAKRRGGGSVGKIIIVAFVAAVLIFGVVFGVYLYGPFNFRLDKADYFVLTLKRTGSLLEAENISKTVAAAGGGGYILNDGDFLVAAFVYDEEGDAQTVLQRFTGDYPAAEVKKYSFGRTKVKRGGDRAAEAQLKNLLNYPLELIDQLTGYVYQLDSFESNESMIMLKVETLKESLKQKTEASENLAARKTEDCYKKNEEFYRDIYDSLCEVSLLTGADKKLTHRLKSVCCEFVEKYWNLREKLA